MSNGTIVSMMFPTCVSQGIAYKVRLATVGSESALYNHSRTTKSVKIR